MSRHIKLLSLGLGLSALLGSSMSSAITRDEVLVRAKAFSFHPWTTTAANLTASCNGAYQSVYVPGDYMGLPYDWGGYMTLFTFDQQISKGFGAGSYPDDGVLACTSGLDCSGFVSKAWDAGHYSTSTVYKTSSAIGLSSMKAGDIFNQAGFHMAMYSHTLNSGEPVLYESVGYNVHLSMPGWSWVDGYTPRKYSKVTGATVGNPIGTLTNPIVVSKFPYSDSRNTSASSSDVLDGCGAKPDVKESGPEYIYQVKITQPGTLTVAVQDDVGVDIDVHLYSSQSTNDCVARDDASFSHPVDCGSYFVVADTFTGSKEYPGAYSLTMAFTPSGQPCGSGPPSYNFKGELGDPCAYPGNENLPFCNPNLGAITCVYTSSDSFCSKPCATDSDCSALAGGCCGPVGNNELYCLTAALCGSEPEEPEPEEPPPPGGDPGGADPGGPLGGNGPGGGAGPGGEAEEGYTATFLDDDDDEQSSSCSVTNIAHPQSRSQLAWLALGLLLLRRRRSR